MKKLSYYLFIILIITLTGCAKQTSIAATQDQLQVAVQTEMVYQLATLQAQPTATATVTVTPAPTNTPEPTVTPQPTFTPTWVFQPAGAVTVPILLYHHIADSQVPNRYFVPPDVFEQQIKWLSENGYTAIPISLVVQAILEGAQLPAKPVVITFDDGDLDVYQNAFPILKKYHYPAVFYLVSDWVSADKIVSPAQIQEMVAEGWEIGSHSKSHIDLTKNHDYLAEQVVTSKRNIEERLGVTVSTFAYPFGMIDPATANVVVQAGYDAGMGLGTSYVHDLSTLLYLSRIEVRSDYDLVKFASLLPWSGAFGSAP